MMKNTKPKTYNRFMGYIVSTMGEAPRQYNLIEGAGKDGGLWGVQEVCGPRSQREFAVYNTRAEAVEHIELSQI